MHIHKWYYLDTGKPGTPIQEYRFMCETPGCKAFLTWEEAERRLNAVEMLSAEQAYSIGKEGPRGETAIGPLLAYARVLEGETT